MEVLALLSAHHLRPTLPRVRILQLFDAETHLSPEDVYHRWSRHDDDLSLATIYRTFAELNRIGLLERHLMGRQRALYTLRRADPNGHLHCQRCERLIEFTDPTISEHQRSIAASHGFRLQGASLFIHGLCSECHAKAA
ncbi:Fur family transcriptional regulator [Chitinimonas naiadis]